MVDGPLRGRNGIILTTQQHHGAMPPNTSHLFTVYWVVPSTCSPLEFSNNWTEIIPGILMGSPDMRF